MFRFQLAFLYFWHVLQSVYRSLGFGPQNPPAANNNPPAGANNSAHDNSSVPSTGAYNTSVAESDPKLDLNKTTVACEVKPTEPAVIKSTKHQKALVGAPVPRVWLWEIFPLRMEKNLIHNDFLLRLRDRKGPVVSAKIPFAGEVVVCIGTDFAKAYHHLHESTASILKGFEFFFKLSMPKEMTEKVTSDSRVNGFLRQSLTTERFVGFIDLMRAEVKNYFKTNWNKPEMEIDLFPQVYKMVIYFLFRCLIGPTTPELFEEFYHAFRDLDVEENLGSPTRIINNLTIGRFEIERKWVHWKKVIQALVDRPKPEEEVFFEVITRASTDEKTGLFDLGSLSTRILWIFFAGSANNFAAISWLLVLIYSPENRHILEQLQSQSEEYNYRYKTKDGLVDFMTYDRDPTKRSLVDRCVQEVVRMCAAALSFRKAEKDFDLDNGKQSFRIKKGTMLGLAYGTVMNDPNVFHDTHIFNPDRFMTEGIVNENQIAFGVGQHPCTGKNLVSITVKTFLYLFFEYYNAESPGKARDFFPQQQPVGIFRPPRPVMFKLMRRKEFEEAPVDPAQLG